MAYRTRDSSWEEDLTLKEELQSYCTKGLTRAEILSYMKRDFNFYAWSMRTLDRRLTFFGIMKNDRTISPDSVRDAVRKELAGPGGQLGYRALHQKLRQQHGLLVPRDNVYAVLAEQDQHRPDKRKPLLKKKKIKGHFSSPGPNNVISLDGHDKLMGYQNSTFPLAIYGGIDTASRKILWLRCWTSNSDPVIVARWYFEYLAESETLPRNIRIDRGTETGELATIHAFLRSQQCDISTEAEAVQTVIYGPSTSNQIERWWRELHERLEKFYKSGLKKLKEPNFYDPGSSLDRDILAFSMIPIINRELKIFSNIWNSHRIRHQKDTLLPDGVPNHISDFPEEYGMQECGIHLSNNALETVAKQSRVMDAPADFLKPEICTSLEAIVPSPELVDNEFWVDVYLHLKESYQGVQLI